MLAKRISDFIYYATCSLWATMVFWSAANSVPWKIADTPRWVCAIAALAWLGSYFIIRKGIFTAFYRSDRIRLSRRR